MEGKSPPPFPRGKGKEKKKKGVFLRDKKKKKEKRRGPRSGFLSSHLLRGEKGRKKDGAFLTVFPEEKKGKNRGTSSSKKREGRGKGPSTCVLHTNL